MKSLGSIECLIKHKPHMSSGVRSMRTSDLRDVVAGYSKNGVAEQTLLISWKGPGRAAGRRANEPRHRARERMALRTRTRSAEPPLDRVPPPNDEVLRKLRRRRSRAGVSWIQSPFGSCPRGDVQVLSGHLLTAELDLSRLIGTEHRRDRRS